MRSATVFISICLMATTAIVTGELKPASDARERFATNFYRVVVYHQKASELNFVISPAALQKLLIEFYNGADDKLADEILWDLQLKHIDLKRFYADAKKEGIFDIGFAGHIRKKQLDELNVTVARDDVLNFFKNDFNEAPTHVLSANYIVAPKELKYSKQFNDFAKEYFTTTLLNKESKEAETTAHKFGVNFDNKGQLELLSEINIQANWKQNFREVNGTLITQGNFKYCVLFDGAQTDFKASVLELPLATDKPLSMLLILPDVKISAINMYIFLSQVMGRSLLDFNELSLEDQVVEVKLPKFKIENKINLAGYFLENTYQGVKDLFKNEVPLNRMFDNLPTKGVKLDNFWQKISVEITANGIGKAKEAKESQYKKGDDKPAAIKFDASHASFFFVIKSEKVLYVMGHYIQ